MLDTINTRGLTPRSPEDHDSQDEDSFECPYCGELVDTINGYETEHYNIQLTLNDDTYSESREFSDYGDREIDYECNHCGESLPGDMINLIEQSTS